MTEDILRRSVSGGWVAAGLLGVGLFDIQAGMAKDLLIPKAQENTEIGLTQSPSFDDQEKDIPQSLLPGSRSPRILQWSGRRVDEQDGIPRIHD